MGCRQGYEPIFVGRQMIIRTLYEKLKDKSKTLTEVVLAKLSKIPMAYVSQQKLGPYLQERYSLVQMAVTALLCGKCGD